MAEEIKVGEEGRGLGPCGSIGHVFRECGASHDPCGRGGGYRGGRGHSAMNTSPVNVIPKTTTKVEAVSEKVDVVVEDVGVVGKEGLALTV